LLCCFYFIIIQLWLSEEFSVKIQNSKYVGNGPQSTFHLYAVLTTYNTTLGYIKKRKITLVQKDPKKATQLFKNFKNKTAPILTLEGNHILVASMSQLQTTYSSKE
jgi:ornithine cyclodeaminase/alanine dehydrogenase-like protein (mu-crystallin family)